MLKDFGFVLSLDDFGTGFSSIGYLRQFPFDILKVDRSFVRDIGINATANALIQSLVSLGDAMDLSVIAEGIENEDQLKLLRLVQCEYRPGLPDQPADPGRRDHRPSRGLATGRRIPVAPPRGQQTGSAIAAAPDPPIGPGRRSLTSDLSG